MSSTDKPQDQHRLHNKVGKLMSQMQSVVGTDTVQGEVGRLGRVEKSVEDLKMEQDAMKLREAKESTKLALFSSGAVVLATIVVQVVIKFVTGG